MEEESARSCSLLTGSALLSYGHRCDAQVQAYCTFESLDVPNWQPKENRNPLVSRFHIDEYLKETSETDSRMIVVVPNL